MSVINPNPKVLKWAREESGCDLKEVVKKLNRKKITDQTILNWEKGEAFPTYSQLETLAYEIYKRPLAIFFFPEPPDESPINKSFRTLPESIEKLNPRMRFLIRKAKAFQLNVEELFELTGEETSQGKKIFRDIQFNSQSSINSLVRKVRNYLKVSLEEQRSWEQKSRERDASLALKKWRELLQAHGVFVFKDSFKVSDFSGFCLYDEKFPIIYINNNEAKVRQIFTLFHELAHILFHTSGFDPIDKHYFRDQLSENKKNQKIETICNEFAGAFLVPDESLPRKVASKNDIKRLANSYSVSQEVILIRLFKNGIITRKQHDEWKPLKTPRTTKKKSGGNYYATQETYLGDRYISLAFKGYYQNRISENQLADFLNVKPNKATKMDPFKRKGIFK